ncbi:MAG: SDR family NAD(P)-dependent oxidoreductase, partial [Eubacteriales bacterium]
MIKYTKEDLAFIKNSRAEQKKTDVSLKGKRCVISGATSGVGLTAAMRLAKAGAEVILVARNKEKAETVGLQIAQISGKTPDIFIADFSELGTVKKAAEAIVKAYDRIDILINSAGLHSTTRRLTPDGNEWVFQVNHLSSFLFTVLLLPLIKKSEQGRIIQVNSEGHRFGGLRTDDLTWEKRPYIGLRAYGASKTAQMMTVIRLAEILSKTKVTINAMHPGAVKTSIGSNNGWLYRAWMKWVIAPGLKEAAISGEA